MGESYAAAGVDIDAGEEAVRRIGPAVRSTFTESVLTDVGGFGAPFALDTSRYTQPVLVSSTDGVGTKLLVAEATGRYDTIGIDLVAMVVDDLVCQGAEPLFLLDYLAADERTPGLAAALRDPVHDLLDQVRVQRTDGEVCLLYTSPSPRDGLLSRMPSSA